MARMYKVNTALACAENATVIFNLILICVLLIESRCATVRDYATMHHHNMRINAILLI